MSGFVDQAQIHVRAGDGGAGSVAFRREAHVDRGGPDGGDGGKGGDVWLEATTAAASLLAFRDHPHRRAGDGAHGKGKGRHGSAGVDSVVPVPEGTLVRNRDGELIADLVSAGDRCLLARGGRGGRGNAHFLSNRRRAPAFAEQGERGEERWLELELRLSADAALVGFPNAGKSTLISRISAAKPKVAGYPFTTLEPHLGVVRFGGPGDEVELVVADVPGLIEGASEGRGLGHRFLRHVERAAVLVVLVDLASDEGRSPADQERVLLDELGRYQPELLERPRLLVGSKVDLIGVSAQHPSTQPAGTYLPELAISAVTGEGLTGMLGRLASLVVEARSTRPRSGPMVVHRPEPEGVDVERAPDGSFVVSGRPAERAVALSDLTDVAAVALAQRRLRRAGVDRALSRAGAHPGDLVRIGGTTFTFEPDT